MAELVSPGKMEQCRSYVSQAKQEAQNGNLEESIRLFRLAHEIRPSEKLKTYIKKLEDALGSLSLEQEDDGFVDVCLSGLMLYGELYDKLFDHQREGVAFFYHSYQEGRTGSILADDMGLGKTIQIIAFLSGMFDSNLIRSVLLIMPTTLIGNWMKEFSSWTPNMRVNDFHGTDKAKRNRNLERIQRKKGVLLTTYNMLLTNWQQLSTFGGKEFVWDYIILDEAHKIKSPSAKTTKSLQCIPSRNRILLTGTPVQNNLKELWALFDYACQGSLLGTNKTFRVEYENPITRARAKDATPGEKALGLKISENLVSIIKPYFLRRTKDEIQKNRKPQLEANLPGDQSKDACKKAPVIPSLPRKNEFVVWIYLAPTQEEIYRNFLSLEHIKELLMTTRSPLAELNVLKKLCDHPRLLSARACSLLGLEASDYSEPDGGENEANGGWDMNREIEHVSDEILIKESGKLSFLVSLLGRLQEEGHRTLVFSQSRKMLDIIERVLTRRHFKLVRIDGTVIHLVERERRISLFQTNRNYSVFLLTTQVGGVGLTLTAATRVVIFDPSWNPATDAQAVDRAYRIGQKENVVIYRLITCGTVEEKIYRRQVFKDSLIRQTTGDKKNPYRYFTMQELRELFTLEDTRCSPTQLHLQSLHGTQRKTDTLLDAHIAYLHMLEIFGISDHDLMYTHEVGHEDKAENEEAHQYIEHRVQKAQELLQLESQLKDKLMENVRNTTEGAWRREMEPSNQAKKKSAPPQHIDSLLPPVHAEPTTKDDSVILIKETDGHSILSISSKMGSLVIDDSEDDRVLQNISNMDTSLLKNEYHQQANKQEYKQNPDLSSRSSLCQARSLSEKNCSPEPQILSCSPPAKADSHLNDVHMISLQQSPAYVSGDNQNLPTETKLSFSVVTCPQGEASEIADLDAPAAFILEASKLSQGSAQVSDILHSVSVAGSPLYQADFRLVLEDSEDGRQSEKEMSLCSESAHSRFRLQLNSLCSSVGRPQSRDSIMGSLILDGSSAACEDLTGNSDVSFVPKKKPIRRIFSDSEEEEENPIIDLDVSENREVPLLNNPSGIFMSTPEPNHLLEDLYFSPRIKIAGRRSTASRRSLAGVFLNQMEDMRETVGAAHDVSHERSLEDNLPRELTQEFSGQDGEIDEESLGETLDSEEEEGSFLDTDSPGDSCAYFEGVKT
ncbi:DNA excision repair protein ERCC-6-like [Hemicordylus capensis]|uniref:DNA excision repair protein ERCC-6-like n=1 Tax=Hemicordylus capensis TaxID=884348 RepID=UPI0023024733|nr:DNA excision repair protein ERCC-6-like [Hemicordylus capensis]